MKNIKQLFCGIVIGVVAAVSVTALAEYIANPNAFPVKVNGKDAQLEGYNIEGSTYFKLRDVADAVGGFSVDFVDNTITIQTDNAAAPEAAPSPTNDTEPTGNYIPNPMYIESETLGLITNDEFQFKYWESDQTVSLSAIVDKANEIVGHQRFVDLGDIMDEDDNWRIVFSDTISDSVPIETYYQVYYPWLKSLQ